MKRMTEIATDHTQERQSRALAWAAVFLCAQEKLNVLSYLRQDSKNFVQGIRQQFAFNPNYKLSVQEITKLEEFLTFDAEKANSEETALLDILADFGEEGRNIGKDLFEGYLLFPAQIRSNIQFRLKHIPKSIETALKAYETAWQNFLDHKEKFGLLHYRFFEINRLLATHYLSLNKKQVKNGFSHFTSKELSMDFSTTLISRVLDAVKDGVEFVEDQDGTKIKGLTDFNKVSKPELDNVLTDHFWKDYHRCRDHNLMLGYTDNKAVLATVDSLKNTLISHEDKELDFNTNAKQDIEAFTNNSRMADKIKALVTCVFPQAGLSLTEYQESLLFALFHKEEDNLIVFPIGNSTLAVNVGNKEIVFNTIVTNRLLDTIVNSELLINNPSYVGRSSEIIIDLENWKIKSAKTEFVTVPHEETQPADYFYLSPEKVKSETYAAQLENELQNKSPQEVLISLRNHTNPLVVWLGQLINEWKLDDSPLAEEKAKHAVIIQIEKTVEQLRRASTVTEILNLLIKCQSLLKSKCLHEETQFKIYFREEYTNRDNFKTILSQQDNTFDQVVTAVLNDKNLWQTLLTEKDIGTLFKALIKLSPLAVAQHNAKSASYVISHRKLQDELRKRDKFLETVNKKYPYDLEVNLAQVNTKAEKDHLKKRVAEFLDVKKDMPRAKNLSLLIELEKNQGYSIPCSTQEDLFKLIIITKGYPALTIRLIEHMLQHKKYNQLQNNEGIAKFITTEVLTANTVLGNDKNQAIAIIREALQISPDFGNSLLNNTQVFDKLSLRQITQLATLDKSGIVASDILNGKYWGTFSHHGFIWDAGSHLESDHLKKILLERDVNPTDNSKDKEIIDEILGESKRSWWRALFLGQPNYKETINATDVKEVFHCQVALKGNLAKIVELLMGSDDAVQKANSVLKNSSYLAARLFNLEGANKLTRETIQEKWSMIIKEKTSGQNLIKLQLEEALILSNFSSHKLYEEITGKKPQELQEKLAEKIIDLIRSSDVVSDKSKEILTRIADNSWNQIDKLFSATSTNRSKQPALIKAINDRSRKLSPTAENLSTLVNLAIKSSEFAKAFVSKLTQLDDKELAKYKNLHQAQIDLIAQEKIKFSSEEEVNCVNKKLGTNLKYKRVGNELIDYIVEHPAKYKSEVSDSDLVGVLNNSTREQKIKLFEQKNFISHIGDRVAADPSLARALINFGEYRVEEKTQLIFLCLGNNEGIKLNKAFKEVLLKNIDLFKKYEDEDLFENIKVLEKLRRELSNNDTVDEQYSEPYSEEQLKEGWLTNKLKPKIKEYMSNRFNQTSEAIEEASRDDSASEVNNDITEEILTK